MKEKELDFLFLFFIHSIFFRDMDDNGLVGTLSSNIGALSRMTFLFSFLAFFDFFFFFF